MKPASTISHIETRSAALQNLQPEILRVLCYDDARLKEGFADRR